MKALPWFLTAAISLVNLPFVRADTILVDSLLDQVGICRCELLSPCCNIRYAAEVADSFDTITFRQTLSGGTINLTAGELVINKSLIIDGDLDDDNIPDITLETENENKIIRISNGLLVTITGLIIQNGNPVTGDWGAGISIGSGGITSLKNSTVRNNGIWRGAWNAEGGGIFNAGNLFIENCSISSNYGFSGGGIYNLGQLSVVNSSIGYNHAKDQGAGIYNHADATLNITTSNIISNKIEQLIGDPVDPVGAGIFNSGSAIVVSSTFLNNQILNQSEPFTGTWPLGGFGGAIFNMNSTTIRNSLFRNNGAYNGGALLNNYRLILENTTFLENSGEFGGAIFNSTSPSSPTSEETMVIRNCTIFKNSAPADQGAGLYMYYAQGPDGEHITNTILAENDYLVGGDDCNFYPGRGSFETNIANLIKDGTCSPSLTGDPMLAGLADNGGPTQTLALLPRSPAINSGNNGYISSSMTTDQRGSGFPRIQYDTIDIGAYEYFRQLISFPVRTPNGKIAIISF